MRAFRCAAAVPVRAFAAGLLALAVLAFATPPAVLAQTTPTIVKLVGNTGKNRTHELDGIYNVIQGFTTGGNSTGYKLTAVDAYFTVQTGTQLTYTMEIWSESSDFPGSKVATLTNPNGDLVTGANRFVAPGGGIDLTAETTYFLRRNVTDEGSQFSVTWDVTTDGGEDSDSLSGWSIANKASFKVYNRSTQWDDSHGPAKIAVHGYAKPDATLSALSATDGNDNPQPRSPDFDSATDTYTVTVANAVQNVKVTATTNDNGATLAGSLLKAGSSTPVTVTMTSGSAATLSNLPEGVSVLTITVTTADGGTTKQYTVNVKRETYAQSNMRLSALSLTDGNDNTLTLDQTFGEQLRVYTVTVASTVRNAKVTATVAESGATMAGSLTRAGGTPVAVTMTSGSAATLSNLATGNNVLAITVTAPNGITQRVYTLTIARQAPPVVTIEPAGDQSVATGMDLTLTGSATDPDGGDIASYQWVATNPSGTVDNTVLSATNTATTTFNATTQGDWSVTLTATDDENDTGTATVTVTVRQVSTDATLNALVVTDGNDVDQILDQTFAPGTTAYTLTVRNEVRNVKVTATANHNGATLAGSLTKAGGTPENVTMTSGTAATLADLAEGANVLTITATAEDDSTEKQYTLSVTRNGPTPTPTNLTESVGVQSYTVSWSQNPSERPTGYRICYGFVGAAGPPLLVNGVCNDSYNRVGLLTGTVSPNVATGSAVVPYTEYGGNPKYRLALENSNGIGLYAAVRELAVLPEPVDAPTGLTAIPGDRKVHLEWTAPAGPGSDRIVNYAVRIRRPSDVLADHQDVPGTAHTVTHIHGSPLVNGGTYILWVRARVPLPGSGTTERLALGPASNEVSATAMVSSDARLRRLAVTDGSGALPLSPAFSSARTAYTVMVQSTVRRARVIATSFHPDTTLSGSLTRAGGPAERVSMVSGAPAELTELEVGDNVLTVTATAEDDSTEKQYTLTVTRLVVPPTTPPPTTPPPTTPPPPGVVPPPLSTGATPGALVGFAGEGRGYDRRRDYDER